MAEEKKSIIGIQYLRAYAAILVVINHFCNNDIYIFNLLRFDIIGGFGVDIFFIISGFIMAYTLSEFSSLSSKQTAISFIKKRIMRIYPIYLIILIPFIALYLLKYHLGMTHLSLHSIIGSILIIPSITNDENYHMLNVPAWTLVYEMFFYITLSITISFSKNKRSSLIIYSLLVILTLAFVHIFNLQGERLKWVNLQYMIGDPIFLDFILVFFLFYLKKINISMSFPAWSMLPLLLLVTSISMVLATKEYPRFISYGLTAFIIVSIFTLNKSMHYSNNQLLLFLGGASYSIYLTHPLFLPFHSILSDRYSSLSKSIPFDILLVIISIALGCMVHKKIELNIERIIKNKIQNKKTRITNL